MKSTIVPIIILSIIRMCTTGNAREAAHGGGTPLYQQLYEEGFYDTAITLLDSLIASDSAGGRELLRYLAFCHIARGDGEAGVSVFERIFDLEPGFRLDTLLTSPKILKVFHRALERHEAKKPPPDTVASSEAVSPVEKEPGDTTGGDIDTVASAVHRDAASGKDTGKVAATDLTMKETLTRPHVKYVPGLLPGGTGQFYHRQWIKGALLLTAQAAALAGCVWSYHTRQSYYDHRYGWYPGNRVAYNRYTNYTRLGSAVFIGAYTFSVVDYFSVMHNKRNATGRR